MKTLKNTKLEKYKNTHKVRINTADERYYEENDKSPYFRIGLTHVGRPNPIEMFSECRMHGHGK